MELGHFLGSFFICASTGRWDELSALVEISRGILARDQASIDDAYNILAETNDQIDATTRK